MQHRWMTLGSAPMTDAQAKEWAGLEGGGGVDTSLEVFFSAVVCLVCKESYIGALPECLGPPPDETPNEHAWQAFFTHPLSDEDAAAWADEEKEPTGIGRPRSIAVLCVLCGERADAAEVECRERSFWTKGPRLDLDPEDFRDPVAPTPTEVRPVRPRLRIQHDADASAYLVAIDADLNTDGWMVVGVNEDGSREDLGPPGRFNSAYGSYHGHPSWFVEGFVRVEVTVPTGEDPFVFGAGAVT